MKEPALVSCIIPVYNAAEYLEQGIESLLGQTYSKLEIILVDDVSTDNSWEISQGYATKYDNVFAFRNNRNSGGPLRGRERGIKESRGEWITFMDCDDYVSPQYIEHLVEGTEGGRFDISVTGHSRLFTDGKVEDFLWQNYTQTTKERLGTFYQHFLDQNFWTDPCDTVGQSLVRARIAKKTNLSAYPDRVWAEDTLMALAFLQNSKRGVNFVDCHDFCWRQRENSGSHGGFSSTANKPAFYRACYEIFQKNNLLPLVSVIIPVFKVETTLDECIKSVLCQTYANLEIILVDDNSPDSSGSIADSYGQKDNRINVIHKDHNEGLNMARSTGFSSSTGDYIMFVDSDDLLTEDAVRAALTALCKNKADFARMGTYTFKDHTDMRVKLSTLPAEAEIVLNGKKDLFTTLVDQPRILGDFPIFSMTVWGVLYTRRSISHLDWHTVNYRAYEDNFWTMQYLKGVSRGVYMSTIGYLYRFDSSIKNVLSKSLTGNNLNGKVVGYMEGLNLVRTEFSRYNRLYKIGADDAIENETELLFMHRANHLTKAGLWGVEGNIDYLPRVFKIYQDRLAKVQYESAMLQKQVNALREENTKLITELASHFSIKRSAKLTIGNIKRRMTKQ